MHPDTDSESQRRYMMSYIHKPEADPWVDKKGVDFVSSADFDWVAEYVKTFFGEPQIRDVGRCLTLPNGNVILEVKR